MTADVTAAVVTRNRPAALARCLRSLLAVGDRLAAVVVVDDASEPPAVVPPLPIPTTRLRQPAGVGPVAGRNRAAAIAETPFVLFLDDDAFLLDPAVVAAAADTLHADPKLVAVAFAQADADGTPWPPSMQPAAVAYPCRLPAFVGFAHLVRRAVFRRLGGYRELFGFYGEEKVFCLRALDAGYGVAYLPALRVAHVPDPAGRDRLRYVRQYHRNDCLAALLTLPAPLAAVRVAHRLLLYPRTARRHVGVADPAGRGWLVGELVRHLPAVLADRRPVQWRTLRQWRRLQRECPPYRPPAGC